MKDSHPVIKNKLLDALLEPKKIQFIVNPHAGLGWEKRVGKSVEKWLDHRKFEYSLRFTEYSGHATQLAREAAQAGIDVVVAVGGDGSVNEVAAGLIHSQTVMGVIPAGSGNGLATHLGYGRNIDAAMRKLNTAEPILIDCGALNDKIFVNIAGIGFDGLVSNLMKGEQKRGLLPYFLKSVRAGLEYTSKPCEIELNGEIIQENCFAISIANGPMYGYNVQIAPNALLDDGLFSVVILREAPRWQYFAAVPSALNGRILKEQFVRHFQTDALTIRSAGENYVHFDGEGIKMEGEMRVSMHPKSLLMLKPAPPPQPVTIFGT